MYNKNKKQHRINQKILRFSRCAQFLLATTIGGATAIQNIWVKLTVESWGSVVTSIVLIHDMLEINVCVSGADVLNCFGISFLCQFGSLLICFFKVYISLWPLVYVQTLSALFIYFSGSNMYLWYWLVISSAFQSGNYNVWNFITLAYLNLVYKSDYTQLYIHLY